MVTLEQGNTFDLISRLPTNSVDLVMTDVPYPDMTIHDGTKDIITSGKWIEWFAPMAREIKRVLKPRGSFVTTINCNTDQAFFHRWVVWMVDELKFTYQLPWYWVKKDIPQKKRVRAKDGVDYIAHFTKSPECATYLKRIKDWSRYNPATKVATNLIYASNSEDEAYVKTSAKMGHKHPGKYPAKIPEVFIQILTKPGDTVLEPFAGSGTTLLVAAKLKRKVIGFEKNPKNVELIRRTLTIEGIEHKFQLCQPMSSSNTTKVG